MEEASSRETVPPLGSAQNPAELLAPPHHDGGVLRRLSLGRRNTIRRMSRSSVSGGIQSEEEDELDPDLVDILDVLGELQSLSPFQYRTC